MTSRLRARALTLGYADRDVVKSLDLDVLDGRVTAIVGANACGKSTLLRGLARLLGARSGEVVLDDVPIQQHSTRHVATVLGLLPLAQQTDLLLLDEPTTFLDISHQVEVLDLLTDLNRTSGTTIVMVLHDLNLAARYADHLIALHEGRLHSAGRPHEVLVPELVQDVFGMRSTVIPDPVSGKPLMLPMGRHHVAVAAD